jgi:hypothetical protein
VKVPRSRLKIRVRHICLKNFFSSKRSEMTLDRTRLIFACLVFFAYLMYSLHLLQNIHFEANNDKPSLSLCPPSVSLPVSSPLSRCLYLCLFPSVFPLCLNSPCLLSILRFLLSHSFCHSPAVFPLSVSLCNPPVSDNLINPFSIFVTLPFVPSAPFFPMPFLLYSPSL